MISTTSADGTNVRAFDDGAGPVVVVLHPGLDDGKSWEKVACPLSRRFRVVRVQRRQYRLDLPDASPCAIAAEVDDVVAVTRLTGEPVLLVGHSSGGIVALEVLLRCPSAFVGAVLYEPPIPLGSSLGGAARTRMESAIEQGQPGKAMEIFLRDVVQLPASSAWIMRVAVGLIPRLRALAPRQMNDLQAIDDLGARLDAYRRIESPVLMLGGERSPAHLRERLEAIASALPHAETMILARRGHDAQTKAPNEVARVIETLAWKVFT